MSQKSKNITVVEHHIGREARWRRNRHKGGVIWLTGLSASGKSTLATLLEQQLFEAGFQTYVLDGDNVRHGLCSDLGFSEDDRGENIRRIGELAALFAESGLVVITAFISPYRHDRRIARRAAGKNFHEVYLHAELGVCEQRDPRGLYAKARRGEILDFTGISAPYEPPQRAELTVETGTLGIEESLDLISQYVKKQFTL